MVVPDYFRSSSVNGFALCEAKFFYVYSAGIEDRSSKSACIGNSVHKGLELAAIYKLAQQKNQATFSEAETGISWPTDNFDYEKALDAGFELYSSSTPHINWEKKDRKECSRVLNKTITYANGLYDPLKRTIIAPEQFFDFELPFEWARNSSGGQLRIRGTIDLILAIDKMPNALEIVDWKSGRRWDWARNVEKTYEKLLEDFQLCLYFYAVSLLYPDVPNKFMTIVWCKDGGPFTLPYGEAQIEFAISEMKRVYQEIINTQVPKRALNASCKFCNFAKDKGSDGVNMCDTYHSEIVELGLKNFVDKYAEGKTQGYSGGGRSNKEVE